MNNGVSVFNAATGATVTAVAAGSKPITLGNFINGKSVCSPVTYTITVNPVNGLSPAITTGTPSGSIVACAGSVSASPAIETIPVTGNNLTTGITVTAPPGFEVSLAAGNGFGASVTLMPSGGSVNGAVYVRSAATVSPGTISGIVTFTSVGAVTENLAVTGAVNAIPSVNPVSNQTVLNAQQTTAVIFTGTAPNYAWTGSAPNIGLPSYGADYVPSVYGINIGTKPIVDTITVTPVTPSFAYIPNSLNNTVTAVNIVNGAAAATIPVGSSPAGVAITADGSLAYITNITSNTISVINTANNTVVATFPVGNDPFKIILSPDGTRLYTTNPTFNFIQVISASTGAIIATIPVTTPDGIVLSPDGSTLYVSGGYSGTITAINTATNTVSATIPLGQFAGGLVISPDGSKLYSVSTAGVSVINTATFAITANIPLSNPQNIAISPDGSHIYVSQEYDSNTKGASVAIINTATNTVTEANTGELNLAGITVSADGNTVYVFGYGASSNSLLAINAETGGLEQTFGLSEGLIAIGNFIAGGVHCDGEPYKFTITVLPTPPSITPTGTINALTTVYGMPSLSASVMVSGAYITDPNGITAVPPSGFEISTDNKNFNNSAVSFGGSPSNATLGLPVTIAPAPVYIRLAATTPVGNYSGNIVLSTTGGQNIDVQVPVSTVSPAPLTITAGNVNKTYGTSLTGGPGWTQFTSTGLQNGETIGSVSIAYGPGGDPAAAVGTYTGSAITSAPIGGMFSASNYTITYIPGNVIVVPASLTVTADNKTKIFLAPNPPLTVTYSGFVNNDLPDSLTVQPVVTTMAVTSSPAGPYPITVNGAASPNYTFIYVDGILTVTPSELLITIPNTFTPNGDGINDTWNIKSLESFPNCTVDIYNRYGERLYSSVGYGVPWDGRYRGSIVPFGAYYYIINLKNGLNVLAGCVTIIR